ncbi:uncharacterized protein LOC132890631 isoform X2 [Neoarius graeffei]|uniref:uncharacterized protein LOC132890631 isoform X2 n=1 Tax=Neoarius graeffei TaxID=443677 RepID=UPI00298C600A|nr:uncharacterized protein LOC132890631 isoform X2 [Neoarius graeffei]
MEKSGGVLSGVFRRSPKPAQNCADGQVGETSGDGSSDITEKKDRADETPPVPPRPSEEELRNSVTHRLSVNPTDTDHNQMEDQEVGQRTEDDSDECVNEAAAADMREKRKKRKGKKNKNPFLPHVTAKDSLSVDEVSHRSSADLAGKSGVLSGFFKRSPKPAQNCAHGQNSPSADGESNSSSGELSEKSGGVLTGFFRRFPKPAQNCADDQGAGSSDIMEKKARGNETPRVPPRPSEKEFRNSITPHLSVTPADTDHNQMEAQAVGQRTEDDSDECVNEAAAAVEKEKPKKKKVKKKKNPFMLHVTAKSKMIQKKSGEDGTEALEDAGSSDITERQERADKAPHVPPGPSEEELRNSITTHLSVTPTAADHNQMEDQEVSQRTEDDSDECVNEAAAAVEKEKPKKKKVKKKKNPFMPHVTPKSKMIQKKSGEDGTEALEKKSLMEQLNEFRLNHSEDEEDHYNLMEWWSAVEQWEPTSKQEDITEKEEARAFALTAEKVQRGIRVFNQLFSERAEALWQHIIDLNHIADGLDRFNKRTKVAQITGGSTSAVGGVATITGLALAPVTMGTSLIVTAVGLGVAAAGGLTSATAGISNTVHGSIDRKKVERIVKDFQSKMADIDKCTRFIKRGIENLRELNAPKVKKLKQYKSDVSGVLNIYEDGAMAGKAVLINAKEITKFTQVAMTAGGTAARAVQVAAMATGILTGLFVAMDLYFVAKDSKELKKGAKSEFAKKIREVAEQLHQGLVELNAIRGELQSSETPMSSISSPSASTYATSLTSLSASSISSSSSSISSISSISSFTEH